MILIMVVIVGMGVLDLGHQEANRFFHHSPTTCPMTTRTHRSYYSSVNSMRNHNIRLPVLWSDCSSNDPPKSMSDNKSSKGNHHSSDDYDDDVCQEDETSNKQDQQDTIRVRIWQALAKGQEVSLAQLSFQLGLSRSEIRHHLSHVKKQAKTFGNKSTEWRIRRGLQVEQTSESSSSDQQQHSPKKMRLEERRGHGKRREIFVRLLRN